MKKRILYFIPETIPTYRADVTVLFGKHLPQLGIFSDVIAAKTPGAGNSDLWQGGNAYLKDLLGGQTKRRIAMLLHNIQYLFRANASHYVAIQIRDMPILATIGLLIARWKGVAFFYWISFPLQDDQIVLAKSRGLSKGLMKFLYPWVCGHVGKFLFYRIVLPKSDHVFVQSDKMKKDFVQCGINPKQMTPVPMGVDMEALQALNLRPMEDSRFIDKRVLVYLGTLDPSRHIETLFSMLAIVKQQIPNVLLLIVGDATEESQSQWLKAKAEAAGVNDLVIWTGWLPTYEGWRHVLVGEVGFSPFPRSYLLDSASPTKVPEYLALGLPVVCNDNPDQEQVILNTGAGICVPYTAENFAAAVIQVLNWNQHERRAKIVAGQEYIAQHRNYCIISRELADAYNRFCSSD